MSLKGTSGTSLVEVMVMMVILSISIVGIYAMVNRGKELAVLTDTRLSAINIAREGLESVTTLRDTFALKGYESGACTIGGSPVNAFFSTDGQVLVDANCPTLSTSIAPSEKPYILGDDKTIIGGITPPTVSFDVCINEFGWYSQELLGRGATSLTTCRTNPATSGCIPCPTTPILCEEKTTQSCKTQFKRKITFQECDGPIDSGYCVEVISKVWWGDTPNDFVELSQIITPLD